MSHPPISVPRRLLVAFVAVFFCATVLAAQSSKRSAPSVAMAQEQARRGNLPQAEKTLWSILSSDPKQQEALTLLGVIRGQQGRFQEAESLFRRVLDLNPKSIPGYKNLVTALIAQGKADEGIQQCETAVALAPQDRELKLLLARLYLGRNDSSKAFAALESIPAEKFPAAGIPLKAAALLGIGRNQEATALAVQVARVPALALELANVFLQARLPAEALQLLNSAQPQLKRPRADFFYAKGQALYALDKQNAAVASFQRALTLAPNSVQTLIAIAGVYAEQKNHADSLRVLKRARTLQPDSPTVLRPLVLEALTNEEHETAIQAAEALAEKGADNLDNLYVAGTALLQEREYSSALPILEKYSAQRPQDPRALLGLGLGYLKQQRYAEARTALERALQVDPNFAEAEYQLGVVAGKEGKIQEAVRRFEDAVQHAPRHAKALAGLGILYLEVGELEKAREVLQRSASADPAEPDTEYQLSLVLKRLNKPEEARQHLEQYQKLKQAKRPNARDRNEGPGGM